MDSSNNEIMGLIPDWLTLTREADIPLGLSREEAFKRARELRRLIREKGLPSSTSIEPDEDFKDVLHALVLLLSESATHQPDGLLEEADTVYQFIRRIWWEDDAFDQRRSLLSRCAEVGLQCAGVPTSKTGASVHRSATEAARESARAFLGDGSGENAGPKTGRALSDPTVLSAICSLLNEDLNSNPELVGERARAAYQWLAHRETVGGLFDERDFFLGELARLAGGAFRFLGDCEKADSWLGRSETSYVQCLNAEPLLARLAYQRLSVLYARGRQSELLELVQPLLTCFKKFGMQSEIFKTRLMEGMALKVCSRNKEAFERLRGLAEALTTAEEPGLLGHALVEIGSLHSSEGRYDEAISSFERASRLLANSNRRSVVAYLKMSVGEALAAQGAFGSAVDAFRQGIRLYREIGMATFVAYSRIVLAQTLLALGLHREAETEILAALPKIEEQKMVQEGVMAIGLLRESIRSREMSPSSLRELREHLRRANRLSF